MGHSTIHQKLFHDTKNGTWTMKKRKSASEWEKPKKRRGLPENVCYVIIILLHHYPFLCYQSYFRCGRGARDDWSLFEFLSGTFGMREYFNFRLAQSMVGMYEQRYSYTKAKNVLGSEFLIYRLLNFWIKRNVIHIKLNLMLHVFILHYMRCGNS